MCPAPVLLLWGAAPAHVTAWADDVDQVTDNDAATRTTRRHARCRTTLEAHRAPSRARVRLSAWPAGPYVCASVSACACAPAGLPDARTEDVRTRACVICVCLSIRACASACARAVARVRRLSIQGPRDGPGKASPVCQGCGRLQWLGLG